jgi:hypothetical protein
VTLKEERKTEPDSILKLCPRRSQIRPPRPLPTHRRPRLRSRAARDRPRETFRVPPPPFSDIFALIKYILGNFDVSRL